MVPVRLYERKHYFLNEELYICFLSPGSTVRSHWEEHKWDNPKVWVHLVEELRERNVMETFHDEIEYLFAKWYMELTMKMLIQKGYEISVDELQELQNTVLHYFPKALSNSYLRQDNNVWNEFLLKILDLEVSSESVKVVNQLLHKMLRR